MWNISNALSGYKETRFWDIIPYAGAGYLGVNNGQTLNKLGVSAGIYNELRINRTINLYVDLSVIGTDRKAGFLGIQNAEGAPVVTNETFLLKRAVYMPSATVGITFNLGKKKNFDRYSSVAPVALPFTLNDYNNLNKRVGALEQENSDLKDKLIAAQNKEPEKVVVKETVQVLVGSTVITFPMGKSTLSTVEREKVEMFAKAFNGQDVVVKVVGSADSKTGTAKRNNQLAKERADVVKDVLIKNGVPANRITVESTLDATENVETSRSAIVTLE
jgi:outer membrane protein OmpA-like peptidoglycan-associated protein